MKVIVCVDDRNGMMFNGRRQSRDRVLREHILGLAGGTKLWMNRYSARQFQDEMCDNICVDDAFLSRASAGEYCFVESDRLLPFEKRIEEIRVFRWNRVYPSDVKLDLDPADRGWQRVETGEFSGSSHEKITEEVYRK